jgi:hypothetical protein
MLSPAESIFMRLERPALRRQEQRQMSSEVFAEALPPG